MIPLDCASLIFQFLTICLTLVRLLIVILPELNKYKLHLRIIQSFDEFLYVSTRIAILSRMIFVIRFI